MKKRILALCLALVLALSLVPAAGAADGAKLQTVRALGIMKGDRSGNLMLENPVTRAQFVTMMSRVSAFKDSVSPDGSGYSLFDDVKADHWASAYIDLAVAQNWIMGYTDGTFRPEKTITLEEACTMALRLLGYDSSTLTGAFPAAQLNKAAALGLRDGITLTRGGIMTRSHCVSLFYNLLTAKNAAGQTHAVTLGYPMKGGEVDFAAVVTDNLEGPFIASQRETLPFTPLTVYRNGEAASSASLNEHDVYYYNEGMATLWIYTDRTAGKVTALTPSASAPAAVTVAGKTYEIATTAAAYALSSSGGGAEGNLVTLLLGMDGKVVGVLGGSAAEMVYYGVVQGTSNALADKTAAVETNLQVFCTDGVARTFSVAKTSYSAGSLVRVTVAGGEVTVEGLRSSSVSGRVSEDGTRLDSYRIRTNVNIIDTASDGTAVSVTAERLKGMQLASDRVRFCALDADGAIEHLILRDATGDVWSYGYVSAVQDLSTQQRVNVLYTLTSDGRTSTVSASGKRFAVTTGGVGITVGKDGSVKTMQQLTSVRLNTLTSTSATAGSRTFAMADDVQIYLKEGTALYPTTASDLQSGYNLTGWYDLSGKLLRVVVATKA